MEAVGTVVGIIQQIMAVCEQAEETRVVLQKTQRKMSAVAGALYTIPNCAQIDQGTLSYLSDSVNTILEKVKAARNMRRILFVIKAKSIAEELDKLICDVPLYLNSLQVSQNNALADSLEELHNNFNQVDRDLLRQLQAEQREKATLQRKLNQAEARLSQEELQRLGISNEDDLQEVIRHLDKANQELAGIRDHKARIEAQLLSQIIGALNLEHTTPTAPQNRRAQTSYPHYMMCPFTTEVMLAPHDPVQPDCRSRCSQVCGRQGLQQWFEQKKTHCPLCGGPLRSTNIQPVPNLREMIVDHMQTLSTNNGRIPQCNATAHSQHLLPTVLNQTVPEVLDHGFPHQLAYKKIKSFRGHWSSVFCVAVTEGGRKVVSGSYDKTLKVWNVDTGARLSTMKGYLLKRKQKGHSSWVYCVAVLDEGRKIVSGSDDKTLKVWNVDTGKCLFTMKGHSNWVNCVAVMEGGRKVVSGSGDTTLKVWNVDTGACLSTMTGHSNWVTCVAVLDGGRKIVSGSKDKTLKVWNMDTGKCLLTMEGHSNCVNCVAVMDGGRKIVSGSNDKTLKVWNVDTGKCLITMKGHSNWVRCVAVMDGGRKVVSGSYDNTLKVWNVDTGKCLFTMKGHSHWVNCVAVLDGGRKVVSGSWDKTLKVWELTGQ